MKNSLTPKLNISMKEKIYNFFERDENNYHSSETLCKRNNNSLSFLIVMPGVYFNDVFVANTFVDRLLGYMFRKTPHHNAIIFTPCNSIHTFFMKFNIDVLFLDKNYVVIDKKSNLQKNKVIFPIKEVEYVIEAKTGAFDNINVGDKIIYF